MTERSYFLYEIEYFGGLESADDDFMAMVVLYLSVVLSADVRLKTVAGGVDPTATMYLGVGPALGIWDVAPGVELEQLEALLEVLVSEHLDRRNRRLMGDSALRNEVKRRLPSYLEQLAAWRGESE